MNTLLLCASIAINALCAGGMFTFPLISPVLAEHMRLTQPQLTTIILAGMMSQYPVAVLVGSIIDRYGPSLCSLIGGMMFSAGFSAVALEVKNAPEDPVFQSQTATFYRLTLFFLLIGLGTVFSYCSSILSAPKFFPEHIGLASGVVMALFGLSPLLFSTIATTFFMDKSKGALDVASFTIFLALLTTAVYGLGYVNLRRFKWPPDLAEDIASLPDERSPLLAVETPPSLQDIDQTCHLDNDSRSPGLRELFVRVDFWLLAFFCVFILGASEMVISNMGSIVSSLPAQAALLTSVDSCVALQVKLISGANTLGRVVVGPLADYVSPRPPTVHRPDHIPDVHKKNLISRFAFLSASAIILTSTFFWLQFGVRNQSQLWALSLGTGFSYSAVFTILPSLISSLWGMQHLGRNFGVLMYAPFTGTPLFSYLYAIVAAAMKQDDSGVCKGRVCWQLTFAVSICTSAIALCFSLILWRRWSGRI